MNILTPLTHRSLHPVLSLQLPHSLPRTPGEQRGEESVVETEDGRQDGQPVEKTEISTHNNNHLEISCAEREREISEDHVQRERERFQGIMCRERERD